MNDSKEYCPHCKSDLQGEKIPKEQQKSYNSTHFTRKIGWTPLDRDSISHWQCPDCQGTWEARPKRKQR